LEDTGTVVPYLSPHVGTMSTGAMFLGSSGDFIVGTC